MRWLIVTVALAGLLASASAAALPDIAERKIFSNRILPFNTSSRPPLFNYRLLSGARSIKITPSGRAVRPNVWQTWTLEVKHAPLPGVTPEMVEWMYNNLHSATAKHPANNQSYLLYHLMHPTDHATLEGSLVHASRATFYEFALTECTQPGPNPEDPWECATGNATNPGYTQQTPESDWMWKDQANSTWRVVRAKGSLRVIYNGCNSRGQCADVLFTTHKWATNKTSQLLEWTTSFKASHYAVKGGWRNGFTPIVRIYRQATHYVQEIGTLVDWLPQAFLTSTLG